MSSITLPIPKFKENKTDFSSQPGISLSELKIISKNLKKQYKNNNKAVHALVAAADAYLEEQSIEQ